MKDKVLILSAYKDMLRDMPTGMKEAYNEVNKFVGHPAFEYTGPGGIGRGGRGGRKGSGGSKGRGKRLLVFHCKVGTLPHRDTQRLPARVLNTTRVPGRSQQAARCGLDGGKEPLELFP